MKIIEYLKDRSLFLIINLITFLIMISVITALNISLEFILIIFILWFAPTITYMGLEYMKFKKYFNELNSICDKLDKKYLLSEVIKEPNFIEEKIIYDLLKETNRNMRDHINHYKNSQIEYREYIETWVHEIKTPIASTMLIIENSEENDNYITMKNEIKKIEDYIDQVLYYSKSNDVSKDYIVKDFRLDDIVKNSIKKNANDLINKRIAIDIQNISGNVYSDPKWIEFMLNQIISNSIKYCDKKDPKLIIYSKKNENNKVLTIKDNGVGISEKDIGRVFEKGFTGENGRRFGKSTGIGLYLCKKLCDKLGLGIDLTSKENKGTEISITFPIGKNVFKNR